MSNFRLVSVLGRGEHASVYAAIDRAGGGLVALKKFHPGMEAFATREYELASRFRHPNLLCPKVLVEEGIVFPHCSGRSMECLSGTFRETISWQLLTQIASALDYLEGEGYCHGGVDPSNILWDGKDFLLGGFGTIHRSGTMPERGHPDDFRFSAPEGSVDVRSDVWSLAASVFLLVLGSEVFNGLGGRAQQAASPVPYLRKSMPELSDLLCRCLAFNPSERPSAGNLYKEAEKALRQYREKALTRPVKSAQEQRSVKPDSDFWPDAMTDA